MDNRRQPSDSTSRTANQNSDSTNFEKKPFGALRRKPLDNRFPAERARFQNSNEKSSSENRQSQPRTAERPISKFPPRDGKFQPPGRFAPNGKTLKPWERDAPPPRIVSEMQVTDGRHRGKYLTTTDSPNARPTARRARETMFRILYRRVRAGRFLDLCAGSGTIGVEAISRGALIATFVERSARMCSFIKKNLETCGIKEGHGEVCEKEVVPFLKQMHKRRRQWDVVYFDAPRDSDYGDIMAYLARGAAIKPKGVLVIEHSGDASLPEKFGVMSRWRVLEQGGTTLSFYERK